MSDTLDDHIEEAPGEPEEKPEKAKYLRFEEVDKVYARDDIAQAFSDICSEMNPVKPGQFASVAAAIGTHSMKTLTPRASQSIAKGVQSVFTINDDPLMFSGNAAESAVAKLLLRPIAIAGLNAPTSLINVVIRGGAMSHEIQAAFASVFGNEALQEIISSAGRRLSDIRALPVKNFPVIFLPHPDGDVQATPISPLSSFMSARKEASPFFEKKKSEKDRPRRGRFKRTEVSSKMQNVSPQLFGGKLRMVAALPALSGSRQAMIWSFANGRLMPRLDEEDVGEMLVEFARLNEADMSGASSLNVTRGMENVMRSVVARALDHAISCCEEAKAVKLDFAPPKEITFSYLVLHLVKKRISKAKSLKDAALREQELVAVTASLNGAGQKWSDMFEAQYSDYVRRASE